ncbi:MAG: cache domain-containing protein [Polyangiaceae bacterium]
MKFAFRAPTILVTTSVVCMLTIALVGSFLTNRLLQRAHDEDYELMQRVNRSLLKSAEDRALTRAEIVEAIPSVHNAFVSQDRAKLLAETRPMFLEQEEKYGLDQAQFHNPGGISFLRLHKPEVFGDEQASYRQMLNDVHQNKVVRKGIVLTKAGPAVSGIVPIFDGKRFAGSFEMGLELAPVFDKMKEAYGLEAAVFLEEKQLRAISTDLTGDVLSSKNRVGKYIRFHATHPDLLAGIVGDKDIDITEPKHYERSFAGAPWGVQLVPLYNYANKQIGVIAIATDFATDKRDANRSRVWLGLTTVLGALGLVGVILIVIRGLLLRPVGTLSQRFEALMAGDTSQAVDPSDYVDELRSLALAYERLRKERSS